MPRSTKEIIKLSDPCHLPDKPVHLRTYYLMASKFQYFMFRMATLGQEVDSPSDLVVLFFSRGEVFGRGNEPPHWRTLRAYFEHPHRNLHESCGLTTTAAWPAAI